MQLNRGLVQLRKAMLQKTIKQAKNRQEKKGYKAKNRCPKYGSAEDELALQKNKPVAATHWVQKAKSSTLEKVAER